MAEAGGAPAAVTRQPNNIVSSPTGRASIRLTRNLPRRPTATVHRQKIISNRHRHGFFPVLDRPSMCERLLRENFPGERTGRVYFRENWNYFLITWGLRVAKLIEELLDSLLRLLLIIFKYFSFFER